MSATITGDVELDARLSQMSRAMQGQAVAAALRAGGLIIEKAAKTKAPVLTGTLRRSIHTEATAEEARIGTNVEYALFVEMGTARRQAKPYLRPAFDENIGAAIREIGDALRDIVENAAR